jgi:hypothetical protein
VGFPHDSGLCECVRHIWTEHLRWAMEKPEDRKVSVLLNLSTTITLATRERLIADYGYVTKTMRELGKRGAFQDLPRGFASSAMMAMQDAVIETAAKRPQQKAKLVEQAFEAFWRMAQ